MGTGYLVSLRLDGRVAVVVGGGPIAAERARDLLDAGADVAVLSAEPTAEVTSLAGRVRLHRRGYRDGDLAGAAVAIATREEPFDLAGFWAESRRAGVLASVLDDLDHADFGAVAQVRRGDLRLTVSTGGTSPALSKRLRRLLEDRLGPEFGALTEALGRARERAGARTVTFAEWAARWEAALADVDALAALAAAGDLDAVEAHVLSHLLDAEAA